MKSGIQFAITLVGVFLMVTTAAMAQKGQPSVKIKKIGVELQPTPNFEAGGAKSKKIPRQKTWLEVEVEFQVKGGNKAGIVSDLQFRYYVALKGEDGKTRLLTGDVNHVNLLEGEDLFSVIYLSPTTLGTVTGDFRNFQKSSINAVAVEVSYNGRVIDTKSDGPQSRWWEGLSAEQGVLTKGKTPFALLWIDRYADVKESR